MLSQIAPSWAPLPPDYDIALFLEMCPVPHMQHRGGVGKPSTQALEECLGIDLFAEARTGSPSCFQDDQSLSELRVLIIQPQCQRQSLRHLIQVSQIVISTQQDSSEPTRVTDCNATNNCNFPRFPNCCLYAFHSSSTHLISPFLYLTDNYIESRNSTVRVI